MGHKPERRRYPLFPGTPVPRWNLFSHYIPHYYILHTTILVASPVTYFTLTYTTRHVGYIRAMLRLSLSQTSSSNTSLLLSRTARNCAMTGCFQRAAICYDVMFVKYRLHNDNNKSLGNNRNTQNEPTKPRISDIRPDGAINQSHQTRGDP